MHTKNGHYLLIDGDVPAWAVVNGVGRRIAGLLDGTRAIRDIAETIAEDYAISGERAHADTRRFVDELTEAGLCWTGERNEKAPAAFGASLEAVYLETTNACNLSCRHCFASHGTQSSHTELNHRKILSILSQLRDIEGEQRVILSGGEPLLRGDCLHIIGRAQRLGLPVELVTNGTLVTRDIAVPLADTTVRVQLSLDGATERTNDTLRGRGSYKLAMGGLQELVRAGLGPRIALSMAPTALNVHEISEFTQLAVDAGVGRVHFSHLARQGRAKSNWGELRLTKDQRIEMFLVISRLAARLKGTLAISGDYCGRLFEAVAKLPVFPAVGCPLGSTLAVRPSGEVFPCTQLLDVPGYRVGNVNEDSIADVLSGTALRAARDTAGERVARVPRCRSCEWRHMCRGACPGSAYHHCGDIFGEDPQCDVNQHLLGKLAFSLAAQARGGSDACMRTS